MNKLSILLLGLALTLVTGQVTCDNPIVTAFGLTFQTGGVSVAPSGLTSCKTLTSVCCDEAGINLLPATIQTKIDAVTAEVKTRDTNLLDARAALALVSANLTAYLTAATAATSHLTTMIGTPVTNAQTVSNHVGKFSGYVTDVITNYKTVRTNYDDYQTKRQTCVVELMKTQADAYCLACEGDHTSTGVDANGDITLAAAINTELLTACYPYLVVADTQNVIFKLNSQIANIDAMTAALILITADDVTGVDTYNTLILAANTTLTAAEIPIGCTSITTCDWITTTLFPPAGMVDGHLLSIGGQEAARRRILEQGRLLPGLWTPIDSGVSITFAKDPNGVGNPFDSMSAVIRNGVISCIAAVFVALLV